MSDSFAHNRNLTPNCNRCFVTPCAGEDYDYDYDYDYDKDDEESLVVSGGG